MPEFTNVIHFSTDHQRTACGMQIGPAASGVYTDEPTTVLGCLDCLEAAAVCPGGCGGAWACSCYTNGYLAGYTAALAQA